MCKETNTNRAVVLVENYFISFLVMKKDDDCLVGVVSGARVPKQVAWGAPHEL